jgi:hypothetical protein
MLLVGNEAHALRLVQRAGLASAPLGAETFTLQSRKAHPAIRVTKHQRAQGPQEFLASAYYPERSCRAAATLPLS